MSKINKIRLSGTDYDIQDVSATSVVELTQQQYNELPATAKTSNILYIITDSTVDYVTSAQTQSAITQAVSGKQDTLVSGTNIRTINNQSLLGSGNIDIQGGGKAVSGGTNISITTGETADTINCTLNLENGTNSQSGGLKLKSFVAGNEVSGRDACAFGGGNKANGVNSFVTGFYNSGNNNAAFVSGNRNQTTNSNETLFGLWALSNGTRTGDANGYSDATLLAVGNGEWRTQTKHNAFEIRQNGDIYIADTNDTSTTNWYQKPMIKLQDALGGGGSSYTAGDGIDITNDVISVTGKVSTSDFNTYSGSVETRIAEDEEVTAAALNVINESLSGKQDTLVSSVNIKTINNQSLLGNGNIDIQGGGKAVAAGRGISITTGETADTVSFDLPISATTNGSILIGVSCSANRDKSFVGGQGSVGQGEGSFAFGQICKAAQWSIAVGDHIEANIMPSTAAFGKYNKQNGGYFEPQSATTLFSVGNGNGASTSARHNAFEIRQNGDIYITLNDQDVKLQDQLGGGGSSYTAGDGINISNENVISVTGKVETSAITTSVTSSSTDAQVPSAKAVNDKLGGLSLIKLTQAEFNALSPNYDSNTLYVING